MFSTVGDVLFLIFVVALIYVLVRPRSRAAEMVEAVTGMLAALVRQVVGEG